MELVIIITFALLLYTYLGYPVVAYLLGLLFPLRSRTDATYLPRVSACIPVFNGSRYVAAKLDSLLAMDYPQDKLEILIYSDGSTDETEQIVERYAAAHPQVRLLVTRERKGKPTALNLMRKEATGEVLFMTDIRQTVSVGCLRSLVLALSDPRVACVSGNLVLIGDTGAGFYWRYETWIRDSEARFRSMVGVTGPVYVIRKADLPEIPTDTILDDQWIPMSLRLQGRRLLLSKDAKAFDEAFDDERESGRKIRTLAGNYQLFARMPRLLLPFVNPSWFETISHKILRLMSPFLSMTLLVTTGVYSIYPGLAGNEVMLVLVRLLFAGQCSFYLAAALALGENPGTVQKVARSFVVMNLAAVLGLWRFLRGAQRVTW